MQSNRTSLACLILVMILGVWSESNVPSDKRYAILDNDWLAMGYLPFLLAMKGDMQVLGLTSSNDIPSTPNPHETDVLIA